MKNVIIVTNSINYNAIEDTRKKHGQAPQCKQKGILIKTEGDYHLIEYAAGGRTMCLSFHKDDVIEDKELKKFTFSLI